MIPNLELLESAYAHIHGALVGRFGDSREMSRNVWWQITNSRHVYMVEWLKLMHKFFEKKTCPKKVLQCDTALSDSCIRASLNQEVVRRLVLCSHYLLLVQKQELLSKCAQKLVNSGFSLISSQIILIHGVTKFL